MRKIRFLFELSDENIRNKGNKKTSKIRKISEVFLTKIAIPVFTGMIVRLALFYFFGL